ncbi:hypothetical protein GH714_014843 [Hevea brasiliensis]|uniref:Uncharacterized protein n=1 Tax=Hevea brasiliensis TaxID=3981 RepID=A0A6A6KNT1_HEVBR|nr:hypothetical protein GH714_014843 [Hevea brasiliensis]
MAELATDEDGPNTQPASAQLFEKLEVIRIEESGLGARFAWANCRSCRKLGGCRVSCLPWQLHHGAAEEDYKIVDMSLEISLLQNTTQENLIFHVLPLLVRAYDDTDLGIQEEVLKNLRLLLSNSMFREDTVRWTMKNRNGFILSPSLIRVCPSSTFPSSHFPTIKCSAVCQIYALCKGYPQDNRKNKKGVTVTDSGIPEVMTAPFPNGLQSQALSKTSGTVAPASKQTTASCPPVDIEWPPQASSGVTPQLRDADKQLNTGASSSSSFDGLDPFANWPPRPSGTSSASGTSNNVSLGSMGNNYSTSLNASTPNSMNFQANGNNSWAFSNQSSSELLKSNQGISTMSACSLSSGHNPQNSIGFIKQSQGISTLGPYNDKKSTDLGSIFGSSKNKQLAPKLAPPP